MNPDNPETEDLEGTMINRYLQDDNIRTKTKVNLNREMGFKAVETLELFYSDGQASEPNIMTRIYIREARTGTSTEGVTDNYIVIRYWRELYQNVIAIKAHIKDGKGARIFKRRCPEANYNDAIGSDCTANHASSIETCFDTSHASVTCDAAFRQDMEDRDGTNFNHPDTGIDLDTFLNGESVEDTFDPNSYSPENL